MRAVKKSFRETSKYGLTILMVVFILIFILNRIIVAKIKNSIVKSIDNFNNIT